MRAETWKWKADLDALILKTRGVPTKTRKEIFISMFIIGLLQYEDFNLSAQDMSDMLNQLEAMRAGTAHDFVHKLSHITLQLTAFATICQKVHAEGAGSAHSPS